MGIQMRRTTFTKDENNNCFFNCIKQSYDNFANIGTLNPISSIGLIQKEEKICQTKTKRKLQHSTATSLKRMNSRATVVFKTKEQFLKSMLRTMASRIHSSLWTTVTQSWALAVWRSKISLRWWSKARWKRLSPKTSSDSAETISRSVSTLNLYSCALTFAISPSTIISTLSIRKAMNLRRSRICSMNGRQKMRTRKLEPLSEQTQTDDDGRYRQV